MHEVRLSVWRSLVGWWGGGQKQVSDFSSRLRRKCDRSALVAELRGSPAAHSLSLSLSSARGAAPTLFNREVEVGHR